MWFRQIRLHIVRRLLSRITRVARALSPVFIVASVLTPHGWKTIDLSSRLGKGIVPVLRVEASAYDWSPDGKHIAYANDTGIWITDLSAPDSPRRVVELWSRYKAVRGLAWSPDGKLIAFDAYRPGDRAHTVWLTNTQGDWVRNLVPPGGVPGAPEVRNTGITQWLGRQQLGITLGRDMQSGRVDTQTGTISLYCRGSAPSFWSPDSTQAIVQNTGTGASGWLGAFKASDARSTFDATANCDFAIAGCVLGEAHPWLPQLPNEEQYSFDGWDPSSRKVLYSGSPCGKGDRHDLFIWDTAEGKHSILVWSAMDGSWSPDGKKIAFSLFGAPQYYGPTGALVAGSNAPGSKAQLYVGGVIGNGSRIGKSRALIPVAPFHPIWSPHSDRLVTLDATGNLVMVSVGGNGKATLFGAPFSGEFSPPSWSSDGKWFSFLTYDWIMAAPKSASEDPLDELMPPIAEKDEATPAVAVKRFYDNAIEHAPPNLKPVFATEYARALEALNETEAADAEYRKVIEMLGPPGKRRGGESFGMPTYYGDFLTKHGRFDDAVAMGNTFSPPVVFERPGLARKPPLPSLAEPGKPYYNAVGELVSSSSTGKATPTPAAGPHLNNTQVLYVIANPKL